MLGLQRLGEMGKEAIMVVPEPLMQALEKTRVALGSEDTVNGFAKLLLPLLEAAVYELQAGVVVRPARRGTGAMRYVVETTQQGDVLTEERLSGRSQPYRCPKAVYLNLASVLAAAERPLAVEEIISAAEKKVGERPADHQVRVVLRLWMHTEPPLIVRGRARYRPVEPDRLVTHAARHWDRLRPSLPSPPAS